MQAIHYYFNRQIFIKREVGPLVKHRPPVEMISSREDTTREVQTKDTEIQTQDYSNIETFELSSVRICWEMLLSNKFRRVHCISSICHCKKKRILCLTKSFLSKQKDQLMKIRYCIICSRFIHFNTFICI